MLSAVQELAAQGTTYDPVWATSGGGQDIGSGIIAGRYAEAEGLVNFYISFWAAPDTNFGSGAWSFTLPFAPAPGVITDYAWPGTVVDVGGSNYAVTGLYNGPNLVVPMTGHPLTPVSSVSPMPWSAANRDRLFVSGWYWRA